MTNTIKSIVFHFSCAMLAIGLTVATLSPSAAQLGTTALVALDPEATAAWYEDRLEFTRVADEGVGSDRKIVLARGYSLIEIVSASPEITGAIDVADGGSEVVVRHRLTLLEADVDARAKWLSQRGVDILSGPEEDDSGRYRIIRTADPDGRIVELREVLGDDWPGKR